MKYIIDGNAELFQGLPDFDASGYVEGTDFMYTVRGTTWFPNSPELLEIRNAAITKAWECPELRARQGARSACEYRTRTAEAQASRNIKIKDTNLTTYKNPELRSRLSDIRKAYWVQRKLLENQK